MLINIYGRLGRGKSASMNWNAVRMVEDAAIKLLRDNGLYDKRAFESSMTPRQLEQWYADNPVYTHRMQRLGRQQRVDAANYVNKQHMLIQTIRDELGENAVNTLPRILANFPVEHPRATFMPFTAMIFWMYRIDKIANERSKDTEFVNDFLHKELDNTIILFDEAHLVLDAHRASNESARILWALETRIRKFRSYMFWATQDPNAFARRFRDNSFFAARPIFDMATNVITWNTINTATEKKASTRFKAWRFFPFYDHEYIVTGNPLNKKELEAMWKELTAPTG